jgi:hypothetical protein
MEESKIRSETSQFDAPVMPGGDSIFFDRHDPPFLRWMEGQGLDPYASDRLVLDAMNRYVEDRNTASIIDYA